MRFKIRKGMLAVKGLRLVGPTDVLVCARVLKALPQERLLVANTSHGLLKLANSNPSFISAWGMPNNLLVLRKRLEAAPA